MPYGVLADSVVFLHFLWIVFLVLGAFLGVRYRKVKYLHLGGLAFAVVMQLADWYCPLTHLEVWLRRRQDPSLGYGGSFIVHYVEEIVYLDVSAGVIFALTTLLCAFNAWMYLKKPRRLL